MIHLYSLLSFICSPFFFYNSTSTVMVLWALHSSDSVKRKERLVWCPSSRRDGTLQMSRPAGERTAPFGPSSSWKRSAELSGSDAANWKTKFSPANVRRLLRGWWKLGGSLTEDRGAKESHVCTSTTNHHSYSHFTLLSVTNFASCPEINSLQVNIVLQKHLSGLFLVESLLTCMSAAGNVTIYSVQLKPSAAISNEIM